MKKHIALAIAAVTVLGLTLTGCAKKCAFEDCAKNSYDKTGYCAEHVFEAIIYDWDMDISEEKKQEIINTVIEVPPHMQDEFNTLSRDLKELDF